LDSDGSDLDPKDKEDQYYKPEQLKSKFNQKEVIDKLEHRALHEINKQIEGI